MKIAYLLDSSSGITKENSAQHLYVVPLEIVEINKDDSQTIYKAGFDIDLKKLGEKLKNGSKFKTGQSVIGTVEEKISGLLKTYDLVIGIPIDSQLSGTFNTWKMLESDFGSDKFHVIDGQMVELGIGFLLDNIKQYLDKNPYDPDKLDKYVEQCRAKIGGTIVVNDVSQLIAGGRLKGFKSILVKALKIKILIKLLGQDGLLEYFDKAKHDDDARNICLDYLDEKLEWRKKGIKRVGIFSTILDEKQNKDILNEYQKLLPEGTKIEQVPMSSVIAVHTGMSTYSILIETN